MFGSLSISSSGMIAQRTRLDVVSANIANKDAIEDSQGNYSPYKRKEVILATGGPDGETFGTHVKEIYSDPEPFKKVYRPEHPHADEKGYLEVPDVNTAMEMVNATEAMRAYEANIAAAEATKSMIQGSLRLIA